MRELSLHEAVKGGRAASGCHPSPRIHHPPRAVLRRVPEGKIWTVSEDMVWLETLVADLLLFIVEDPKKNAGPSTVLNFAAYGSDLTRRKRVPSLIFVPLIFFHLMGGKRCDSPRCQLLYYAHVWNVRRQV